MPSATSRRTRQRSATPKKQLEPATGGLTPGWTEGNPDLFKEPLIFSPLKTRPSTRRAVDKKAVATKRTTSKKPKSESSAMTRLRQTSAPRESLSDKKRSFVKSPPQNVESMTRSTRSRSRTPSRVERARSTSPQKGAGSKIPVKSRERTPSRKTPSRSNRDAPRRTTRSRSRSRTRATTPLKRSASAGRKTPSSNKREIRKPTPSRQTPSRQGPSSSSKTKKPTKRPASPARVAVRDTPVKAAKVLGKPAVETPREEATVSTPHTSTPARGVSRKRPAEIPVSEIRFSKRLAAKGVANTSIPLDSDSEADPAPEETVANGNSWGSWCTIL